MNQSHFFAYISKMRWIQRWGMKRNAIPENVMEHSYEVATIAHALALIRQQVFGGEINPADVAVAALFHDVSEVLTGDLPSPIKYHNAKIRDAYKEVEYSAEREILSTLPDELKTLYEPYLLSDKLDDDVHQIIKAADLIAAYIKCKAELNAGNLEFAKAARTMEERLNNIHLPEADWFREKFLPSFDLTLDELIKAEV
ncbi:MAG: 5'-deoxynucleotidase [Pseudomonadales bacterium]|nr:5'-deoxynucleotidase [Pseudomonadales bacterium]